MHICVWECLGLDEYVVTCGCVLSDGFVINVYFFMCERICMSAFVCCLCVCGSGCGCVLVVCVHFYVCVSFCVECLCLWSMNPLGFVCM